MEQWDPVRPTRFLSEMVCTGKASSVHQETDGPDKDPASDKGSGYQGYDKRVRLEECEIVSKVDYGLSTGGQSQEVEP